MDNKKTIFWNTDTQKDFMDEDGSLYVQGAESIKPILAKLTKYAKENNIKVINTADWHYDDSEELSDTPDFINTFPPHCMSNTPGVWYVNETKPVDDINIVFRWDAEYTHEFLNDSVVRMRELIITKDKFDVFAGNPHTDKITNALKKEGYTDVVVYGVTSDICVSYAVKGLLDRGFNVHLIEDGIKALNDDNYQTLKENWLQIDNFNLSNYNENF